MVQEKVNVMFKTKKGNFCEFKKCLIEMLLKVILKLEDFWVSIS